MAPTESTSLVHIVATVNATEGTGEILYVNPSNVRSNAGPAQGMASQDIALVLRDGDGNELGRSHPEVRYEACAHETEPKIGLIQQDIAMHDALARVELVRGDEVLDTFEPDEPAPPAEIAADLGLGPPQPGRENKRSFGTGKVQAAKGVTYMIQARPDNRDDWQTLSIGRPTPEFTIDKNQFPGASKVAVRVVQNAGFKRATIDEREVALEE